MPLNWLDFHELCIDWSFEEIQFLRFRIDVSQKLVRFARVVENFIPNHIIFRIVNVERLHPAILAASRNDAGESSIGSKVELKVGVEEEEWM